MKNYQVEVHACKLVNVAATSKKDAIKRVLAGQGDEVDGGFDDMVCGGLKAVRELEE
jgi:hypothetical protein